MMRKILFTAIIACSLWGAGVSAASANTLIRTQITTIILPDNIPTPEWLNTPATIVAINGVQHYLHYYAGQWYDESTLPGARQIADISYPFPAMTIDGLASSSWGNLHHGF